MATQIVEIKGTKVHTIVDGREGAPWIVLIHSLGTNAHLYEGQIPALVQDFRVLRYDMRGHGRSSVPPGPYTIDALVDDLFGLLAHFRIARTHLVGISLGALTAIAAAQRGAPQIASFAFCDSRADVTPDLIQAIDDGNRLIREQGMDALAEVMVPRLLAPATFSQRPQVVAAVIEMIRNTSPEAVIAGTAAIKSNRILQQLKAINVPSLFIAGDQDPAIPTEVMHRMQVQVPRSEFSVLVGASHLSNLDQPHSFNHVLLAFLRKQARAAA